MQLSIRPLVLGLLLASGAHSAHAQSAVPEAQVATAATTPSGPLDLSLSAPVIAPPLSPPAELATASVEVQRVARWIARTQDNSKLPYLLVDKVNARVYAFSAAGQLQQSSPALLGLTHGDRLKVSNETQMSAMTEQDRVTPAGRFVSRLAIDADGKELLAIDYEAAISLHPVVKGTPLEHRAERLASPTSQDNRISFGCINVPPEFYTKIVSPAFAHTKGIVYILPETSSAAELFGFQPEVDGALAQQALVPAAPTAPAAATTGATALQAPLVLTIKASDIR